MKNLIPIKTIILLSLISSQLNLKAQATSQVNNHIIGTDTLYLASGVRLLGEFYEITEAKVRFRPRAYFTSKLYRKSNVKKLKVGNREFRFTEYEKMKESLYAYRNYDPNSNQAQPKSKQQIRRESLGIDENNRLKNKWAIVLAILAGTQVLPILFGL